MNEVPQLLEQAAQGQRQAAEALLPVVYDELRRLAAAKLSNEANHTLQPTALVHEAWLRLVRPGAEPWENRGHFFAAAAEAMRRILIDRARQRQALKRGATREHLDLDQIDLAVTTDEETLLQIDDALARLAVCDARAAEVVKLRFFVGLEYPEAAATLGISERSAKRAWTFARAWLFEDLSRSRG